MACASCHTPPIAHAIWDQATELGPGRRTSSDGACPSPAHIKQNPTSDHNPKPPTCDAQAVDVSQDPPRYDAHQWAYRIAAEYVACTPTQRQARFFWLKYIVSFNGTHDIIFDPSVSLTWRLNSTGSEHWNHTHYSINPAGLTYTGPIFVSEEPDMPLTTPDLTAITNIVNTALDERMGGIKDGKAFGPMATLIKHYLTPVYAGIAAILGKLGVAVPKALASDDET